MTSTLFVLSGKGLSFIWPTVNEGHFFGYTSLSIQDILLKQTGCLHRICWNMR